MEQNPIVPNFELWEDVILETKTGIFKFTLLAPLKTQTHFTLQKRRCPMVKKINLKLEYQTEEMLEKNLCN